MSKEQGRKEEREVICRKPKRNYDGHKGGIHKGFALFDLVSVKNSTQGLLLNCNVPSI